MHCGWQRREGRKEKEKLGQMMQPGLMYVISLYAECFWNAAVTQREEYECVCVCMYGL